MVSGRTRSRGRACWQLLLVLACGSSLSCSGRCKYDWVLLEDVYFWGKYMAGAGSGLAVADVDADGKDEVLVGNDCQDVDDACYNISGDAETSGVHVLDEPYEGGALSEVASVFIGERPSDADFGLQIDVVGDVTGDAYADLVIFGDRRDEGADTERGWHVFAGPLGSVAELRREEASAIVEVEPADTYWSHCGAPTARSLPVDGDGQADLVLSSGVVSGPVEGVVPRDSLCLDFEFCGLASGDVDGDGHEELLFSRDGDEDGDEPALVVWSPSGACEGEGPGAGTPVEWTLPARSFDDVLLAGHDLDGDGVGDVVYGQSYWDAATDEYGSFVYLLTDGSGGSMEDAYARFEPRHSGDRHVSLATGDFDGDGQPDLAFGIDSAWVYVYRGPIEPGVHAKEDADVLITACPEKVDDGGGCSWDGSFAETLAAGDLDGDGRDELVIGAPRMEADGVNDHNGRVYIAWGGGL